MALAIMESYSHYFALVFEYYFFSILIAKCYFFHLYISFGYVSLLILALIFFFITVLIFFFFIMVHTMYVYNLYFFSKVEGQEIDRNGCMRLTVNFHNVLSGTRSPLLPDWRNYDFPCWCVCELYVSKARLLFVHWLSGYWYRESACQQKKLGSEKTLQCRERKR